KTNERSPRRRSPCVLAAPPVTTGQKPSMSARTISTELSGARVAPKPRSDPSQFPQPLKPSVPYPSRPRSSRSHETITAESSVIDNFPVMETEMWANYSYIGHSFGDSTINDNSSSVFSDCNSGQSGEFPSASSENRRILIACTSENSNDLILQFVADLESCSIDE
ncbi:hypothetical protein U1Q18_017826, partial [Sarracenia purpurea var. burkii]